MVLVVVAGLEDQSNGDVLNDGELAVELGDDGVFSYSARRQDSEQ